MMQPRSRQLVVSLIVACAMFMQNLDSTIIATALPAIGASLGENPLRLNVAITCYLLSLAVFIPISGWTADRFGARRVFTGAIIVFGFETIGRGEWTMPMTLGLLAGGVLCLILYVRHAGRVDHRLIDLALMRIPTYAMARIGGFLFRMGLGALPFLMPLMLQVGFGLDALSSGLITLASAAGAMSNKAVVAPIIRAFGFRHVLIAHTMISSAFLFGYSFFQPATPHLVIFLALLAGGFFRSLQMTSLNTLAYADVPGAMLSRATSLTSMAQQLSQSVGVGTGAPLPYPMLAPQCRT